MARDEFGNRRLDRAFGTFGTAAAPIDAAVGDGDGVGSGPLETT